MIPGMMLNMPDTTRSTAVPLQIAPSKSAEHLLLKQRRCGGDPKKGVGRREHQHAWIILRVGRRLEVDSCRTICLVKVGLSRLRSGKQSEDPQSFIYDLLLTSVALFLT